MKMTVMGLKSFWTFAACTLIATAAYSACQCERANGIDWVFDIDDGVATVCGMTNRPSGVLRFPSKLGGCPVKNIDGYVIDRQWYWEQRNPTFGFFTLDYNSKYWVTDVTSVYIPDSVTNIMGSAFQCWSEGYYDDATQEWVATNKCGWIKLSDASLPDGCQMGESGVSSVFYGTPFGMSEKFPEFIYSRSGKTLYGVKGYEGSWTPSAVSPVHIPAVVAAVANDTFADWRFNYSGGNQTQVIFDGSRPHADEAAFRRIYDNREWDGTVWTNQYVTTVYYRNSSLGWAWGETWCGVKTYAVDEAPDDYKVQSAIKFSGYPHDGYRFHGKMKGCAYAQDDYCLDTEDLLSRLHAGGDVARYDSDDGSFFAIPVTGASSKSEIAPVLQLLTARADMIASIEVWTDEELRKILTSDITDDWVRYDDDNGCGYIYKDLQRKIKHERYLDTRLWPDWHKSVAGRYWVFVKMNDAQYVNSSEWGGDFTFRVGLKGTSEWTPTMHISIQNNTACSPEASLRGLAVRGVTYYHASDVHNGSDPFGFAEYEWGSGTLPFKAEIDLSGPGTLYLCSEDKTNELDSVSTNALAITGNCKSADYEIYTTDNSRYDNPWWPTTNFCAHAGAHVIRTIVVSAKTTLRLLARGEFASEIDILRPQFFPAGKKSVAIESTYGDLITCRLSNGDIDHDVVVRGKVTGTGVYSSGEHVRLVAEPATTDEQFDHWEILLGALPSTADLSNQVLEFTLTADQCGWPSERKQIVVRPVWKQKNAVTVLANVPERGTVTGSGKYFSGATVTLTATPSAGYVFAGWSDGDTSATRKLTVAAADAERVIYACFCRTEERPYTVVYRSEGSADIVRKYISGKVYELPQNLFMRANRKLVGWQSSFGGEPGKRYDAGVLVFNLAKPGETVSMTAIWE